MKGYYRKRGNSWSYTVDIGKDEEGKRKQKSKGGFRTKKDAVAAANELINQLNKGLYSQASEATIEEYLIEWLELAVKNSYKDRTYKIYKRFVNMSLKHIGELTLREIKPSHVQKMYKVLSENGQSNAQIRYLHKVLNSAFKKALEWEYIYRNPFASVELPKDEKPEFQTWSIEEVNQFLDYTRQHAGIYHIMYAFAVFTGCRIGEVLGLRWKDIDFDAKKVSIRQALSYDDGGLKFVEPKTEKSKRSVSIDDHLIEELKKHRLQQNQFRLLAGPGYQDNGLAFSQEDGRPIIPKTLNRHFQDDMKAAGVQSIRFHDLRHTHATLLLRLGTSPKVVSERLGHASTKTTMDVYSHVTPDLQQAASDQLAKALRK